MYSLEMSVWWWCGLCTVCHHSILSAVTVVSVSFNHWHGSFFLFLYPQRLIVADAPNWNYVFNPAPVPWVQSDPSPTLTHVLFKLSRCCIPPIPGRERSLEIVPRNWQGIELRRGVGQAALTRRITVQRQAKRPTLFLAQLTPLLQLCPHTKLFLFWPLSQARFAELARLQTRRGSPQQLATEA
jgi:hypothetical protein